MILQTERGNTRSHSVVNSLWKRYWTWHKTYYRRNEWNPKSQIYTHSTLHFKYMEYNSCFLFTENI